MANWLPGPWLFNVPQIGISASLPSHFIDRFRNYSSITLTEVMLIYSDLIREFPEYVDMYVLDMISPITAVLVELANQVDLANMEINIDIESLKQFLTLAEPTLSTLYCEWETSSKIFSSFPFAAT